MQSSCPDVLNEPGGHGDGSRSGYKQLCPGLHKVHVDSPRRENVPDGQRDCGNDVVDKHKCPAGQGVHSVAAPSEYVPLWHNCTREISNPLGQANPGEHDVQCVLPFTL